MALEPKDFSRLAQPPLEWRRSRPRDVRLTAGGVVLTTVGVALLIGSVVVTILLSRVSADQIRERRLLDTTGTTASARVVRLWRESGKDKTPRVEYAYDVDGRQFEGRAKLPLERWHSLHTGDSLDVRYLPSDPAQHSVVESENDVLPPWLPIFIGLLTSAVGLGSLGVVRKQRRLLSEGRVARATVTKVTKRHTTHGGSYRSVAFTFSTLSGSTVTGKDSTHRNAPDIGAPIWVVYDPDNPKRSAPYPFQLVTLSRST